MLVVISQAEIQNVVDAAEWVKSQGGKVLGMLGFSGGQLRKFM